MLHQNGKKKYILKTKKQQITAGPKFWGERIRSYTSNPSASNNCEEIILQMQIKQIETQINELKLSKNSTPSTLFLFPSECNYWHPRITLFLCYSKSWKRWYQWITFVTMRHESDKITNLYQRWTSQCWEEEILTSI